MSTLRNLRTFLTEHMRFTAIRESWHVVSLQSVDVNAKQKVKGVSDSRKNRDDIPPYVNRTRKTRKRREEACRNSFMYKTIVYRTGARNAKTSTTRAPPSLGFSTYRQRKLCLCQW